MERKFRTVTELKWSWRIQWQWSEKRTAVLNSMISVRMKTHAFESRVASEVEVNGFTLLRRTKFNPNVWLWSCVFHSHHRYPSDMIIRKLSKNIAKQYADSAWIRSCFCQFYEFRTCNWLRGGVKLDVSILKPDVRDGTLKGCWRLVTICRWK